MNRTASASSKPASHRCEGRNWRLVFLLVACGGNGELFPSLMLSLRMIAAIRMGGWDRARCVFVGVFLILVAGISLGHADPAGDALDGWKKCKEEWRTALKGDEPLRLEAATDALREWRKQQGPEFIPESVQQEESFRLLDFYISSSWAKAGDYKKALAFLRKEAAPYQHSKGRFLQNTRNPDYFALDVFVLHAEIMANLAGDAKVPGVDYKVFALGSQNSLPVYAFVYEPIDECEGGVLVEGVAADEQRQMIVLTVPGEGKRYKYAGHSEVVGKRDRVTFSVKRNAEDCTLRLSGVTKFIEYLGDFGAPVVRQSPLAGFDLRISDGKLEQPSDAIKRESAAEPDSPDSQRQGPAKPSVDGGKKK